MASGIISALGGAFAGGLIGQAMQPIFGPISAMQSGIISADLAPALYLRTGSRWLHSRFIRPGPGEIWSAYNKGLIGDELAQHFLGWNGIVWRPEASYLAEQDEAGRAVALERAAVWEQIRKSTLDRPGISVALDLFARGYIDEEEARRLLMKAGADVDAWMNLRAAYYQPLELGALVAARNREYIDDNHYSEGLKHLGYRLPQQRQILDRLRSVIPGVGDLISFGVRDVWDREAVESRQLFDEVPDEMRVWAARQGLFGDSGIAIPGSNPARNATWAEVYWAAHWQAFPTNLAYEAYHRLRPGRVDRFRNLGLQVDGFTLQKLQSVLKIADYPKPDRDYLAALSYQPLMLRQITSALKQKAYLDIFPVMAQNMPPGLVDRLGVVTREWAIEQFRDRGLHPEDAALVTDLQIAAANAEISLPVRNIEKRISHDVVTKTLEAYRIGALDRAATLRNLLGAGMTADGANRAMQVEDLDAATDLIKQSINALRHDYLGGVLTEQETRDALGRAGVTQQSIDYYLDKWTILRNRTRRTATTEKILHWFERGFISQPEVVYRLNNLGWSQTDMLLLLREAQLTVQQTQAKILSAAERSRKQQQHQLEGVAKDAQKVSAKVVSELRKNMPKGSILAWAKKGIVSPQWAKQRLLAQRWPPETVDLWLQEATAPKKEKASGKKEEPKPAANGAVPPA